ncbi:adenosylmethionine decarboxylase [Sphaerisporangium flaviroseum]
MNHNDTCQFAGRHVVAELTGVNPSLLDDEPRLRGLLHHALTGAKATVLHMVSHRFTPQGVTMLALLSESHASIHTYPEAGSCFVDIFTCGHNADPECALASLVAAMRPSQVHRQTIDRGMPEHTLRRTPPS